MSSSPTLAGFGTAFRRPSIVFAEIAWRWTYGATALALFLFSLIEYLETLPVSNGDLALLATRQPALIGRALSHILRGSLNRTVLAASIGVTAVGLLWVFAASVGRFITLSALIESSPMDASHRATGETGQPVIALLQITFLRAAVGLAMLLSVAGAVIASSLISTPAHPRPGLAFLLFLPLASLVLVAGWSLNWWLSFAAIAVVRERKSALDAISSAVKLCRRRPGAVIAVGIWTGLAHLVTFSIATTAVSFPLALAPIAPSRLVLALIAGLTLVYFAVADWLCIARLAGYVAIAVMPEEITADTSIGISIDRDEPILSDLARGANPVFET